MIYILTYFLLVKLEAETAYFIAFWIMAIAEALLAIFGGIAEAYNERNK